MKTYTIRTDGSLDLDETTRVRCDILKTDNKHKNVVYADHVRVELCGDVISITEED